MACASGSSCSGFSLLCLTSSLMSLLFHVSSASSQSAYRFTLGLAAGGQSHTPLARLHTFTPSPTHLPTCPPPALCCPHKKRLSEAEDNGPSICPSCRCPALREVLSAFFHPSVSLRPVSLCSRCVMGKPAKRWILLYLCEWSEGRGRGAVPGPCVWGFRLPAVFLLLPSSVPPFSSFPCPGGDSLMRSYRPAVPSSLPLAL